MVVIAAAENSYLLMGSNANGNKWNDGRYSMLRLLLLLSLLLLLLLLYVVLLSPFLLTVCER
jgi:hypothetical protein